MNWDDLRVFLALARSGRLALTAKAVNLDATTVTRRISKLGFGLGAVLFEANKGTYALTSAGRALLAHAEAVEAAVLAAQGEVNATGASLSGTVRLSVAEGFGTWVVARHLSAFQKANPDIIVELIASSGFLSPSRREADVAVMLARPTAGPLVARRLTDYRLGLFANRDYLDAAPPLNHVNDLRRHTLIGYVSDLVYSPALDYADEVRPGRPPDLQSSSINAQLALTVAGGGIGILPLFIGNQSEAICRILPTDVELVRSFWLVVHKDVRRVPRVARFVEWLVNLVEDRKELFNGRM